MYLCLSVNIHQPYRFKINVSYICRQFGFHWNHQIQPNGYALLSLSFKIWNPQLTFLVFCINLFNFRGHIFWCTKVKTFLHSILYITEHIEKPKYYTQCSIKTCSLQLLIWLKGTLHLIKRS